MNDSTTTSRAPVTDATTTDCAPVTDSTSTRTTTPTPPDGSGEGPPPEPPPSGLRRLGIAVGDRVRWRDRKSSRWREGRVLGIERDGSVGVRDARGASRALRVDRLEVRDRGPRGGVVWEPLPERAARTEQLGLWQAEATEPPATRA